MKERLVTLENRRTDLLKDRLEAPNIIAVNRQIKRVQLSLEQEVAGIRESLNESGEQPNKAKTVGAEEAILRENAKKMQTHELTYRRLQTRVESKKTLHQDMLTRLKEAELQADTRANNVRVLDAALVPVYRSHRDYF